MYILFSAKLILSLNIYYTFEKSKIYRITDPYTFHDIVNKLTLKQGIILLVK